MKPRSRKIKKRLGHLLRTCTRKAALKELEQVPGNQLVGPVFSYFYNGDELIKFRSITIMGELVQRIAGAGMENARVVLRRIMWNLNDESGGIGWGSPEAMGEILSKNPELALEFKSILFSYLDPGGNYLEHETLQQGVIWGIGTYLGSAPEDLTQITRGQLFSQLHSKDPIKRCYALRALINANRINCSLLPDQILTDQIEVPIFSGWNFVKTRISDMAMACDTKKKFPDFSRHTGHGTQVE